MTVDNRLPAVACELESSDPGGRREWSSDCKENRRGTKYLASDPWRFFGLSERRKVTGGGGLRVDTLLCRDLVSPALGLNSFLTRPPNRFTLLRNVRLPTEILAV